MNVRALVVRYPVAAFCAFTFVISWGWILAVVIPNGFPVRPEAFERLMLFVYPAMFVGPCVAGILVAGMVGGRAGLGALWAQLVSWRVGARWYAVALFTAPLAILVVLLALSLASPNYLPLIYTSDDKLFLVLYPIVAGVMTALFEEPGWTGVAAAALLNRRYGIVATGLMVGLAFAAWNFLVVAWSGAAQGDLSPAVFLPIALFTWLPTHRVLVVWIYARTQSLLMATLMSASLWAAWIGLTPQAALAGAPLAIFYVAFTLALWAVVGAVLIVDRGHSVLSRAKPGLAA